MKKTGLWIVVIAATIASLFISCSNAGQTAEDAINAVGYVRFGNQKTRDLNPSYEIQGYENLYWFYDAKKNDEYGKTGEGTDFKIPGNSETGKGLDGQVGPFSQGSWIFTLKAYTPATEDTGTLTPDTATLVYEGTTEPVTIKGGEVKNIPVSVEPVGDWGTVKFGDNAYFTWAEAGGGNTAPNIKFTFTKTEGDAEPVVVNVTPGEKTADGKFMLTGKLPVDGLLSAGFYTCTVIAYIPGNENTPLATQTFSLRVYGNATTIINGSITEGVDSYVSFDVEETEMNVFQAETSGPTTVEVSVTPEKTENKTSVEFPAGALDTDGTFFLEVGVTSSSAAPESFKVTGTDADGKVAVAGINLSLTKVTSVDGSTSQEGITSFNEQEVIVTTYISTGLDASTIEVYYDNNTDNHEKMTVDSYNSATGELKFKTTHFSSFYVVAKCEVMNTTLGRGYATFDEAIKAAPKGSTLQLMSDVVLDKQIVMADCEFTLDLAGHKITAADTLYVTSGVLYLDNNAKITLEDSSSDNTGMIDFSTDRTGSNGYKAIYAAFALFPESAGAELVVNGGTIIAEYYPIAGNGTIREGASINIIVNGGKLESNDGTGIYLPGEGYATINGGEIIATDAAIEIRAGALSINGGSFSASSTPTNVGPNGNGTTSKGAAIAIAQHTTQKPISVVINDGVFNGYSAFYESNPEGNPSEALDLISVEINGGTFNATNGGTQAVYSKDCVDFIYGGNFNKEPNEAYVAPGYAVEGSSDNWTIEPIFAGGDGTINNPFVIKNEEQFSSIKLLSDDMKNGAYYYFSIESDLDYEKDGVTNPYILNFRGELDFNGHKLDGLSFTRLTELNNGKQITWIIEDCYGGAIRNLEYRPVGQCNLVGHIGFKNPDDAPAEFIFENITVGDRENPLTFKIGNNGGSFVSTVHGPDAKLKFKDCINYCNMIELSGDTQRVGIFLNGYTQGDVTVIFENCDNYGTFRGQNFGYVIGNDSGAATVIVSAKDCENFGAIYATNQCGFVGLDDSKYVNYTNLGGNARGTIVKLDSITATVTTDSDKTFVISGLDSSIYPQYEIAATGYATLKQGNTDRGTQLVSVRTERLNTSEIEVLSFKKLSFIDKDYAGTTTTEDAYGNEIATVNGIEYYVIDLSTKDFGDITVEFDNSEHVLTDVSYALYVYDADGNIAGSKTI